MKLLYALPFLIGAACTYDWTVGPPPTGSSSGSSGTSGGSSSGTSGSSGGTSGTCDGLKVQIDLARTQILHCSGTCSESLINECGCTVPVSSAQSSAGKSYAAAVDAFKKAGCTADCSSGCSKILQQCFGGVCT